MAIDKNKFLDYLLAEWKSSGKSMHNFARELVDELFMHNLNTSRAQHRSMTFAAKYGTTVDKLDCRTTVSEQEALDMVKDFDRVYGHYPDQIIIDELWETKAAVMGNQIQDNVQQGLYRQLFDRSKLTDYPIEVTLDSMTAWQEELAEKLKSSRTLLTHTITSRGIWEGPDLSQNLVMEKIPAEKPWIAMNDKHHKRTRKHRK